MNENEKEIGSGRKVSIELHLKVCKSFHFIIHVPTSDDQFVYCLW